MTASGPRGSGRLHPTLTVVDYAEIPLCQTPSNVSPPQSRGVNPAASAAPTPALDPPGVRVRSQGLLVLAKIESGQTSGPWVFPRSTVPAALRRAATVPSCSGT